MGEEIGHHAILAEMRLLTLTLLLATACAHPHARRQKQEDVPLTCESVGARQQTVEALEPQPPRFLASPSSGPTGRVDIHCAESKQSEDRWSDCQFNVQSATLTEVAAALAGATGLNVGIHPDLISLRVTAVMPHARLDTFLAGISGNLELERSKDSLTFLPPGSAAYRSWIIRSNSELPALRVRLVPFSSELPRRQLVAAACGALSAHGSIEAVDHMLIVKDIEDGLTKVELLVRTVDWYATQRTVAQLLKSISAESNPAKKNELLEKACLTAAILGTRAHVPSIDAEKILSAAVHERDESLWLEAVGEACPERQETAKTRTP